jgi:poly-gamma-glutamate capsule biosynthesis protein CapA/YwtB (metallophosphatase superfamily)
MHRTDRERDDQSAPNSWVTLFLGGDVMPGRGIDQVLSHPSVPLLYEPYIRDARDYVELAEAANGPIPRPVGSAYIWGDALAVLEAVKPDLRIVNLETSVTTSSDYWPDKGINYRMHPQNIGCLTAANIDCCVLANNHVLDWGYEGLAETIAILRQQEISAVGAGLNRLQAESPAMFEIAGKGRLLVFAYGSPTSGVHEDWAATRERPGINLLPDFSDSSVSQVKKAVAAVRKPGDVVLFSLHWGGNWGYHISSAERQFAHKLIDEAGVDALYGHSAHHIKGIEVYREKLILYGCGDFINDYEGIKGYEEYRDDLALMYFPSFGPASGRLVALRMMPMQIRRFQSVKVDADDCKWLVKALNREGKPFGTSVQKDGEGYLRLSWSQL